MFMTFLSIMKTVAPFLWEIAFGKRTLRQGFRYNWRLALLLVLFLCSMTLNVHLLRSMYIHEMYYIRKVNKLNKTILDLETKQTCPIPKLNSPPISKRRSNPEGRGDRRTTDMNAEVNSARVIEKVINERSKLEHIDRDYGGSEGLRK